MSERTFLIGLSGRRGSGKDTFLTLLNDQLAGGQPPFAPMSFADPLKEMAAILTGDEPADFRTQAGKAHFLGAFEMSRGELLQKMGTDALRNGLMDDVWIRSMHARLRKDARPAHCITDVRFPNEAAYVRTWKGVLIRLVGDPQKQAGDGSRNDLHPSETALDDYADFDIVIENNSTLKQLRLAAMQVARYLTLGVNPRLRLRIDAAANKMWADAKPMENRPQPGYCDCQ